MKKSILLGGAIIMALGSCQNEDTHSNATQEGVDNKLTPISLGLKTVSADVEAHKSNTRGTGTVGDVDGGKNEWRFENLYVLMTTSDQVALEGLENNKPEWGFTSVRGTVLKEQFNNTFYSRPKKEAEKWVIDYKIDPNEGNSVKYYPARGASDFFAYHVDDAAVASDNGNPQLQKEVNSYSVAFKIDGSQDLLAGKADVAVTGEEKGFSAKTARKGIIPNIKMKHLLTRFTFTLKNGNEKAKDIEISKISVLSKVSGKMYVAYKDQPEQIIVWADEAPVMVDLKQLDASKEASLENGKPALVALEPIVMDGQKDVNVGDALFVKPGETEYTMFIEMTHKVDVGGQAPEQEHVVNEITFSLSNPADVFEAGRSYHINATIYGLEDIQIETELEPWQKGEDINVGSDEF